MLVALAVVVVAGLGALRLSGVGPQPSPPPPTSRQTPDPAATAWPRDMGSGTLYALDESGVVIIDVGSGLAQRSNLDVSSMAATLTAFGFGVLVWPEDGHGRSHLITAGSPDAHDVSGVVAKGRQFLAGPDRSIWVSRTDPAGPTSDSTWRLVDETDAVASRRTVSLAGTVLGDGAGGLFDVLDAQVRHVVAGRPSTTWTGEVLAVGPDGYQALSCVRQHCRLLLHDRVSGREAPAVRRTASGLGALSPGNRFVASVDESSVADHDTTLVRVSVPQAEGELRSFPASDGNEALTWVSDRWLVADGRDGVVLYDAVDDRLVAPSVGLGTLSALVFVPA